MRFPANTRSCSPGSSATRRLGPAARALASFGAEAVSALIAALDDDEVTVQIEAASALGQSGPDAGSAAPQLLKRLDEESRSLRLAAIDALCEIGVDPSIAAPCFEKVLQDRQDLLSPGIVKAIGWYRPGAGMLLPSLVKLLVHPDEPVRMAVERVLQKIGPDAVKPLIAALDSTSRRVRCRAARVLGEIGPQASEAIPALEAAKRSWSLRCSPYAAKALKRITTIQSDRPA